MNRTLEEKLKLPTVKVSIGCGMHWKTPFDEWINVDGIANEHTDIVCEFGSIPLPDECADYLECGDTIEHIVKWRKDEILKEWFRILKIGGTVHIGTPNFHRAMTEYTVHTIFGKSMPSGWVKLHATDSQGNQYETDYHIMAADTQSPLESARQKIYAWQTTPYEQHYDLYTFETLTETLQQYGFGEIDFSDSPPQELKDPRNAWWFVVTAKKIKHIGKGDVVK
jgi:predicted SAM-dependent methyltransferase